MQISIARPPKFAYFETVDLKGKGLSDMAHLLTENNFSPAIFKNGKRNLESFEIAYCIGLDIDNDGKDEKQKDGTYRPIPEMSIAEAKEAFKDYMHLILPSRSHQKEKDGKVKDRFRVILFFSEPVTDLDTFKATWHWCKDMWPAIDPACKDPSRGFYMHSAVESIQRNGKRLTPVVPPPKEQTKGNIDLESLPAGSRGELSKDTFKLIAAGVERGSRNGTVFKAAKDFQQNLYTLEEAEAVILEALVRTETIASDFSESEARATIRSAFNTEAKHDPRIKPSAFKLVQIGDLYDQTDGAEMDWLVEGLLQTAGTSLLAADPKTGKSVIARQLCASVLKGEPFFTRTTRKGSCQSYAIEEYTKVVAKSFKRMDVPRDAELFVHAGDPLTDENVLEDLEDTIRATRPALAVIDTTFDVIQVQNEKDYGPVKKAFRRIRKLARETGAHIMLIHHAGKPPQGASSRSPIHAVLGSTAITAGVDNILVIQLKGTSRVIYTAGRDVDQWNGRLLEWDSRTKTYSLGKSYDDF